jgi:TorA maturation chaperone TorD
MTDATIAFQPALADEDRARAEFYALLGRLYTAAPDAPLLAAIGASELWGDQDTNPLAGAWNRLVLASRGMDAEAAEQEYTDLFVGVGKAECNLLAAYWMPETVHGSLAAIRAELAVLGARARARICGLRRPSRALCETMRLLIAGTSGRAPAADWRFKGSFSTDFLSGWVDRCCDAITQCGLPTITVE